MSNAMFSEEAQDQEVELLRRIAAFDLPPAIEAIAEKAHEGWMREKIAHGFADHIWIPVIIAQSDRRIWVCDICWGKLDFDLAYSEDKHHPDMLPYSQLAERIKEEKRSAARITFEWLSGNHWKVVRDES